MRLLIPLFLFLISNTAFAGYDLHITRKEYWADDVGAKITIAEWRSYIELDNEIQKDRDNSKNDFIASVSGESFPIWYDPKLGELYTKNPSEAAIEKLKKIAAQLKAKVQGDDGEIYAESSP